MALKKGFITDYGVTVTYWKVVSISTDWLTKRGRIKIAGYIDEAMRAEGKQFLQEKYFDVTPLIFEEFFGATSLDAKNPIKQAYALIRSRDNFFADAIDG